jgi:hypothetical protein
VKTMSDPAMDEKIESDPFLQLLTDALRAGPGSPEWHQAVARVNNGEPGSENEYALLVQARENLASGKAYRQVRAGAGFTRKMLANIVADEAARKKSPVSASFISYIGAGLVVGALAIFLHYITQGGGPGSTEDLSSLFFGSTVISANLDSPLSPAWRLIGPLPVDPTKGLAPRRSASSTDYAGGGIVNTVGITAAEPFAVEATFQFQHVSDEVVPQLFVTDDPEFSSDRGISPHELVWLVRGQQAQVALPDGQLTSVSKKVVDGESISVRIVVGATNAVVTYNGNVLWSGPSQLADKPRYVGVRLLCRKDERRSLVTVRQLRVLAK